ncbi:hypothetical protein GCM10022295_37930 [Streptomyces osmaniensis]|uniref:Uncharacterized protein n=1 Tax=Streptomyces osmaniensis TaxID=593134 RepID=A0ABP6WMA6_9ACTN
MSAERPGKISIALTVTAYLGQSNTVLVEKPPVAQRVDVVPFPGLNRWSWVKGLWQWMTAAITSLGGLAVSLSAIAAVVVMAIRRQLPGNDAPAQGVGSRARVRSVRMTRSSRGRPLPRSTVLRSLRPGRRRDAQRAPHERSPSRAVRWRL